MMQAEVFSKYLKERFGITLPPHVALEGSNSLRAMNSDLNGFKTTTPKGIPASRMKGKFPKPSTSFIQLFGHLATRNTIDLEREDAIAYMEGKDLEFRPPQSTKSPNPETGYILLKYKNAALGIGFYREKENKIECMLPKGRRIRTTQG